MANKENIEDKVNNLKWQNYDDTVRDIVQFACKITEAEVGVLFLTSDGFFLEAANRHNELSRYSPPASELPTYHLPWWEEDDKQLDGITAFVAIRQKIENLNQKEVFNHPAWKGKWDAVFLGGEHKRCKGILAIPLQSKIGEKKTKVRVHGVLKVENPKNPSSLGRFKPEQQEKLIELSQAIASKLDNSPDFWQEFVKKRADLKVSYIVDLLERGRSINYNLSQSLGYVCKLFEIWLRSKAAIHAFWRTEKKPESCILHTWDYAKGDEQRQHVIFESDNRRQKKPINELVKWFEINVGPKIIQPGLPIDRKLWGILFPDIDYQGNVDVIRLKAGKFDLGIILLSRSPIWKSKSCTAKGDKQVLESLTRLAINVVSILGRFIEDEYETTIDTYLPKHRPPRASKVCSILFADIKNFSQLIQILRLMGKSQLIEPFMDHFCTRMGEIINSTPLGRIDKFLGDGVMALFGEYLYDPDEDYKKVVVAVDCAWKMLSSFRVLYEKWIHEGLNHTDIPYGLWYDKIKQKKEIKIDPVGDLKKRFNEDVQIDITIGINIGEIYLDYFGDRAHREYTAIGDHINFTHRIREAAGRFDESVQRTRSNILVSQTVYQFLYKHDYLLKTSEPFWLYFKGFGIAYPVYELEYTNINHTKIAETIRSL